MSNKVEMMGKSVCTNHKNTLSSFLHMYIKLEQNGKPGNGSGDCWRNCESSIKDSSRKQQKCSKFYRICFSFLKHTLTHYQRKIE